MRVGVIGLGIMGGAMAQRLLETGHEVFVFNRTRAKAEPLLSAGARWADSPAEVARHSEVVISIVTDPTAVEQITFGEQGVLLAISPESVHCDMSTVSVAWTRHIAQAYQQAGKRFVQAPVLGGRKQILEGTLLVFGGGAEEDVRRCEPAWRAFSDKIWRFPHAEQATVTKLACNMLIAHMMVGLGQSLLFAAKGGVPAATLVDILSKSNLGAPMYSTKGKALIERNFQANFYVRHLLKDLSLAEEAARETNTMLPLNALTRELFVAAMQQGYADEDYAAVVKVMEGLVGIQLSSEG
ncbi:MAG: NAD(P)-dependent oxidoreductase [Armatimonadota bacterium]|nr:NAD(P)-dependent oxidoreductase [Armatimonadota bacterium]MDW8104196.1 NAD(P)-dependent oxidoreductase [Armatimonadota bacterium]